MVFASGWSSPFSRAARRNGSPRGVRSRPARTPRRLPKARSPPVPALQPLATLRSSRPDPGSGAHAAAGRARALRDPPSAGSRRRPRRIRARPRPRTIPSFCRPPSPTGGGAPLRFPTPCATPRAGPSRFPPRPRRTTPAIRQRSRTTESIQATHDRHCEERSDEAIHAAAAPYGMDCFASGSQ